jgi:hypothetical protein
VRASSAFCPQCGRAMKADGGSVTTPLAATQGATPPPLAVTQGADQTEPRREERKDGGNSVQQLNSQRQLNVTAPSIKADELPQPAKTEQVSLPAQIAREQLASGRAVEPMPDPRPAGRGQRVVGAARDVVEERLAPRVEKLRQASNVVWGEAQDDPNLRFILVAVLLFILALVIILLGTYLR